MATGTPLINPKTPKVQSFLLADQVYQDISGKMIIAGTFNQLLCREFPSGFSRTTFAYLRLTNCRETFRLQLRYVDLEDGSILMESPEITCGIDDTDPNATREVIMEVPPFPMPNEGWYEFGAYCNDELVGRMRINVALAGGTQHESSK